MISRPPPPDALPRVAVVTALPPDYPYKPFEELAETLHRACVALGCETVRSHEFYARRLNIVLGANKLAFSPALPPAMVIFNLEPLFDGAPWLDDDYVRLLRAYPVWDYSALNVGVLKRLGVTDSAVMPIGHVPELERITAAEPDIDVLFYGSMKPRRAALLDELVRRGLRVARRFGVYGTERDRLIARSRMVLNLHNDGYQHFEIVRVSYLLANARFVVSERGADRELERPFEDAVAFGEYAELADLCEHWLARPEERAIRADRGREIMRARPQQTFLAPELTRLARRFSLGPGV